MDEPKSVIPEVGNLIRSYELTSPTMGIADLLNLQDSLSVSLYRLAEEAAEAKKGHNWSYFNRKVEINRSMQSMIMNQQMTVSKADIMAKAENKDKMKAEVQAEATAYKLDLLLKQGNRILSAIQQRISFRKQEFDMNRFKDEQDAP